MVNGTMKGFLALVVIILDEDGKVVYTQQLPEIVDEPDYEDVLKVLK